jgi:hypothetical protein
MPTRSPTRLSTLAIGTSSKTINPLITSVLPSSGGMNLRISGIVVSRWHRTTRSVSGQSGNAPVAIVANGGSD